MYNDYSLVSVSCGAPSIFQKMGPIPHICTGIGRLASHIMEKIYLCYRVLTLSQLSTISHVGKCS